MNPSPRPRAIGTNGEGAGELRTTTHSRRSYTVAQHLHLWLPSGFVQRRTTRLRKGGTWLKTMLVTCAWTAVRTKDSYLRAQFLRIKSRRGAKKAIMAIAASMLTACYFMLRDEVPYKDLGAKHFDRHDTAKTIGRLVKRLKDLGCEVDVRSAA